MSFTPAELQERRKYLGASESAAAIGESPWYSQLELYQSKKGVAPPIETTLPMMIGTALEPICLEMFERERGVTVEGRQQQCVDEKHPWRRCTLDGWVAAERAIVEAKTSGDYKGWGEQGTDEIPLHYLYNVAHSFLAVPAALKAIFPVIIGRSFRIYEVQRNDELCQLVDLAERAFWNDYVLKDLAPPPRNREDLKILYPRSLGITKLTTPEINVALQSLVETKEKIKGLKEVEETRSFEITSHIGNADTLVSESGVPLATFKSQDRKEFITKASSFRVLRIKS